MRLQATVSPDLCNGCGLCCRICPEVFRLENSKAVVYSKIVPHNAGIDCKDAALLCLTGAIKIEESCLV